jgi:uncharacterized protein YndB with AHSA1/START domain
MSVTERLEIVAPEGEPVLEMRRFVKAPPELVFDVWTNPVHIPKWWGPRRLEVSQCEIDLRPGGHWRFVQRAPDGMEFVFYGEYLEVDPPHRLVNTWIWEGMPDHPATETISFEACDGGTMLRGVVVHDSVESRDQHLANGMEEGMRDTFARLDELLEALQAS